MKKTRKQKLRQREEKVDVEHLQIDHCPAPC